MARETIDYDPIEELVEAGRRELSNGDMERARWCFEEALSRQPGHPRAMLGLSYVERHEQRHTGPPPSGSAAVLSSDLEVIALVREKRYEDALAVLRDEAEARPDDAAIAKSIAHLEQHLARRYEKQLGGPSVRLRLVGEAPPSLASIRGHLDGDTTLADALARSGLPPLETLAVLLELQTSGDLEVVGGAQPAVLSEPPPRRPDAPVPAPEPMPELDASVDDDAAASEGASASASEGGSAPEIDAPSDAIERPLGALPARAPKVATAEMKAPPRSPGGGSKLALALAIGLAAVAAGAAYVLLAG
ncbi:MAG TPA: hypothetical protein RMH85_15235 [Polyangiaceae bacterium LLY-WYZ-15_(1-7)]|nr:hypothetical protein [Myxococcales bacterium]MAT29105.1 hypothetical protein [Sandaracinus sp.]MBJ73285.1 hypothetical protein [Sandaracinus sp.]HJL05124.1 hypothetical protein [Polyangiaceae bacterium LLY-WYZ-15_(1-7)]HJL09852.1 hypothetical protein [Polyangiaceae bacterium LLY-WYZ-15_(1-7)]